MFRIAIEVQANSPVVDRILSYSSGPDFIIHCCEIANGSRPFTLSKVFPVASNP